MTGAHVENKLCPEISELNQRIVLLEKSLREKERDGEALQESEKRYRRLFESAKDGILILDADTGKVVDINPFLLQLLGYSYDTLYGQHIWELGVFKDITASKDAFKILQDNEYIRYEDLPLETCDGQPIAVEFISNVYLVDHKKVIQCNIRDITANKRAKAERTRLMAAIEQVDEIIVMTDAQGNIQFVNPAFERITGYSCKDAVGQNPRILKSGEQGDLLYRNLWSTISGGNTWTGRMVNKRKDGTLYTEEATISPVRDASGQIVNYVAIKRDISEHLQMAAQLQQAQKMEAIGHLAGGVAHDFNNMLTVILGYAALAIRKIDEKQPLYNFLTGIIDSAERSTDITKQLLVFSRKQTIIPMVLDLNQSVEHMIQMLKRIIGENINLAWIPTEDLCPIKMDPAQIDQILLNLCVNARDAISDVGKIIIETENVTFDLTYCAHHAGFSVGEYILLAVSDNGCGMDKEIVDHVFEPFFTSKAPGLGTGLGLSTVYGIVKQNNGFINVYSEAGRGTTFRVYLPRHAEEIVDTKQESNEEIPHGCGETVLVVDDEPAILKMVTMMLEELGYLVLAADTPEKAVCLAEKHSGEIGLLLTDVVMPGMNGRVLAERLKSLYASIKVLFMSGYTANVTIRWGELDEGVNLIQKPFSMKDLAVKVRKTLE